MNSCVFPVSAASLLPLEDSTTLCMFSSQRRHYLSLSKMVLYSTKVTAGIIISIYCDHICLTLLSLIISSMFYNAKSHSLTHVLNSGKDSWYIRLARIECNLDKPASTNKPSPETIFHDLYESFSFFSLFFL